MYIYDGAWGPDTANTARTANNPGTRPDIMIHILDCLQAVNPYIPLYNQAHVRGMLQLFAFLQLAVPPGVDGRQYNLPTANEIAAILPGDNAEHATSG